MPVQSVPVRDASIHYRLLQQYLILLKKYPILTKSVTSFVCTDPTLASLFLYSAFSQSASDRKSSPHDTLNKVYEIVLEARKKARNGASVKEIDTVGMARYAIYGLFITGPVSHYFYQVMEVWMPSTDPYCIIKRLLLDRLIFAPGFLLLFYLVMNLLEAKGWEDFEKKMRSSYWTALKMNWKVWTPFQFINVNFVPVQFRVLFANMVALFWYAYLASVRK